MNLAIYAPYDKSETALAALRLADLALSYSMNVSFLSACRPHAGIHPYWDRRVRTASKKNEVYKWALHKNYFAWFLPSPDLQNATSLVTHSATHCLVVDWHRLGAIDPADVLSLFDYDRVISPTRSVQQSVIERVYGCSDANVFSYCHWDTGWNVIRRSGYRGLPANAISIYVPTDRHACDHCGDTLLTAIAVVLRERANIQFTFEISNSWPTSLRARITDLRQRYHHRFQTLDRPSWWRRQQAMIEHDWLFSPFSRSGFGLWPLMAMACCTPVIAFDVAPFSDIIKHENNGLLIACEIEESWVQAPTAKPECDMIIQALKYVADTPELLSKLRYKDWRLQDRADLFRNFWAYEWDLSLE